MIPFAVVVLDVLRHGLPEMPLPDRNQPVKAFFLDRPHETFRVGVGVSRQLHRRRAVRRKPFELPIPSIRYVAESSS
jgi:hypothetical protein